MEVGIADGVEEKRVLDRVESFRNVDGHSSCSKRWFGSIEAIGNARDGWKKGSGSGVVGTETMLRGGGRESRGEKRKDASLQKFGGGAEERDGAIGGRDKGGFVRFRDRDDESLFPDRREVSVEDREVKERGEVRDGTGTEVF